VGQVVGATDDRATEPLHDAISPDDVAATFFSALGIPPGTEYHTNTGRPIQLVRDGQVISGLLA
jgi:hypothetical protein